MTNESPEIGRIHAFTKGWLERESNFLHMGYKYVYAMLKAGLYDEFYEAIETNFVCFMDPEVYGRPITENSTFIAPSNNPDPKKTWPRFCIQVNWINCRSYIHVEDNVFMVINCLGLKMNLYSNQNQI